MPRTADANDSGLQVFVRTRNQKSNRAVCRLDPEGRVTVWVCAAVDCRVVKAREARDLFGAEWSLDEHEKLFTLVRDRATHPVR